MVWYGMVWYGMVWYGMVCCCFCCCEGTQHVPTGEIARHALPSLGAREQSAGVTLAGRVPTTTEGGGGGGAWSGGGGARGGGWGHLWKLPWSPPPSRGGRVTRPVRSGCGGGGGRGGDLGVGKARPGPRTLRALPEHPAEWGRSSCAAVAWPGALARASSLLRGRREAWELLSAGA